MDATVGGGSWSVHLAGIERSLFRNVVEQRDAVHREPPLPRRLIKGVGQLQSDEREARGDSQGKCSCIVYKLLSVIIFGGIANLMDRPFKSSTSPNLMTSLQRNKETSKTLRCTAQLDLSLQDTLHCSCLLIGIKIFVLDPLTFLIQVDRQVGGALTWLCPCDRQTDWCRQVSEEKKLAL